MHPPRITNLRTTPRHTTLDLTIHEGRNRIIRRACVAVGLRLISLRRIRVGPVTLGALPEGEYRNLTPEELEALR
jgi:23S rRNA pseudouridine2605 synthase